VTVGPVKEMEAGVVMILCVAKVINIHCMPNDDNYYAYIFNSYLSITGYS